MSVKRPKRKKKATTATKIGKNSVAALATWLLQLLYKDRILDTIIMNYL